MSTATPEVPSVVKPDKLLHDLSDIWLSMAKPDSEFGSGVLRACSMTLVVVVDDEDDAMDLGETLSLLMREHPSRAIVIRLREGSGQLEGRVFAQCWKPFGHGQQICCEQVELTASLNRLADVPSIVSPLTVPAERGMVPFLPHRQRSGYLRHPGAGAKADRGFVASWIAFVRRHQNSCWGRFCSGGPGVDASHSLAAISGTVARRERSWEH